MNSHIEEAIVNLTIFLSWLSAKFWDHSVKKNNNNNQTTKLSWVKWFHGGVTGQRAEFTERALLFVSGEKRVSVGRPIPLPERPEDGDGGGDICLGRLPMECRGVVLIRPDVPQLGAALLRKAKESFWVQQATVLILS